VYYNIIQTGKLPFCKKSGELTDFIEDVVQKYLDYSVFRKRADDIFWKGIGYYGSAQNLLGILSAKCPVFMRLLRSAYAKLFLYDPYG